MLGMLSNTWKIFLEIYRHMKLMKEKNKTNKKKFFSMINDTCSFY